MLIELRKGATGFLVKLLLGLLILSFALWGIGDVFRQGGAGSLATVGGDSISQQEFDQQISHLKRTFGASLPESGLNMGMLQRMVLNEMIARKLIAKEAERLGIRLSDDALAREISRNEQFLDASGAFDKTLFQQSLRQNNLREADYLKQLGNALREQLVMEIMNGEDIVPPGYAQTLYQIEGETRSVDLLAIQDPQKDFSEREPSEDEVRAYYDAHQAQFVAPEYRTLSILRLLPEQVTKDVKVSRQEVYNLYNERSESLMLPEKRDVMHMLFSNKANAENAYSMLRSGKSFDETVALLTPVNKDALHLGPVTLEQLPAEAARIFSMQVGEFSEPIESRFGWHVYFLKGVAERRVTPFEDVRESLEQELRQHKAEVQLQDTLEMLEDALAGTDSLDAAAKEAGLTVENIESVSPSGMATDNREILPADKNAELLSTAFKLPVGERSELMRQPDGGYFLVKVTASTPQRQRTLDEVRGQVTAAWKQEQLQKSRQAYASEISTALAKAHSLEEAKRTLENFRFERTPEVPVRRNGTVIGMEGIFLPPEVVSEIFELPHAGKATAAQNIGEGFVIALLKNITPAVDAKSSVEADQQMSAVRRKLRTDYKNEMLEQYIAFLRGRYPVTINEALLAELAERKE